VNGEAILTVGADGVEERNLDLPGQFRGETRALLDRVVIESTGESEG